MERYRVKSRDVEYTVTVVDKATGGGTVTIEDREFQVEFTGNESKSGLPPVVAASSAIDTPITSSEEGSIVAPIPGTIISILVKVGDRVSTDQVVLKLEAMKMENEIASLVSGTVKEITVSEGSDASYGQLLMTIG
ncbi:MAG: biotin/lipoyl-binding protein [Deltaproteobacteria bacterium]|nr:biotin/lipoyl-binding protein [Deltaproteobacteria bacterium]